MKASLTWKVKFKCQFCPVLSCPPRPPCSVFTTTTMTDMTTMTRPPRSLWPLWLWTPGWPWRTWGICSLFEAVGGCSQGSWNGGCLKTVKRPNGQLWPTACHTYSESYCSSGWYSYKKILFEHSTRRHIFANTVGRIWVNFPRTGKMVKMWHFLIIFGAPLWPNGRTDSTFLNCSEEIFFCSPLAHLEPELELFEFWDDDDLSKHYLVFAIQTRRGCSMFISHAG